VEISDREPPKRPRELRHIEDAVGVCAEVDSLVRLCGAANALHMFPRAVR
jgi:hypothetical protein